MHLKNMKKKGNLANARENQGNIREKMFAFVSSII